MRDKHPKPVDIFKKCMLRSAKPCAPRSRKPQQMLLSCMAFSVYELEVVRIACQSSSFKTNQLSVWRATQTTLSTLKAMQERNICSQGR